MEEGGQHFRMEPFELPEGTIVRTSSEYPNHIHLTDPYGGEVNLPLRDTQLALVRLLIRLASFLPGASRPTDDSKGGGSAYPKLRGRVVSALWLL